MRNPLLPRMLPPVVGLLVLVAAPRSGEPCAPAPPMDQRVIVTSEEALIIWDADRRTQHFIRRAEFQSEATAFGFLVPTPTKPELDEVPTTLFEWLEGARAPAVEELDGVRVEVIPSALLSMFAMSAPDDMVGSAPRAVEVLGRQTVAGYDAAILRADDPAALARWLTENGFSSRPDLEEWLAPYVTQGWIITAFKIAGDPGDSDRPGALDDPDAPGYPGERVGTASVRMTFTTDQPFFPYREPADQREGDPVDRSFLVYVIASDPMTGALGADGADWPAQLLYRKQRSDLAEVVGGKLAAYLPAHPWLHAWYDYSSPRPGTADLFFSVEADAMTVVPDPIIVDRRTVIPIPLDILALVALIAWLLVRRARRRRMAAR